MTPPQFAGFAQGGRGLNCPAGAVPLLGQGETSACTAIPPRRPGAARPAQGSGIGGLAIQGTQLTGEDLPGDLPLFL
jgi:hypothetical protein